MHIQLCSINENSAIILIIVLQFTFLCNLLTRMIFIKGSAMILIISLQLSSIMKNKDEFHARPNDDFNHIITVYTAL